MRIIFFSEIKWNYLRTRKQQFLRRFPKDWEILFIEPYRKGVKNSFKPQRDNNIVYATFPFFKNFAQKTIKTFLVFALIRGLFVFCSSVWLLLLLRLTHFRDFDVIFVSNIYAAPFVRFLKKGRPVIYDCNDDHLGFPNTPIWGRKYFLSLCELADKIVGTSPSMYELIPPDCYDKFLVIGNGVDSSLFVWNHPALVYIGTIAEWLDFGLLEKIADTYKDKTLVVAGNVFPAAKLRLDALRKKPNVRYLGELPHAALPAVLESCDVGLIPFVCNDLTKHLNPNKLFEYLAAGLPVVSMSLSPELLKYRDRIFLADTGEEFVGMIQTALSAPRITKDEGKALAAQNDWNIKAKDLADMARNADALFKTLKKGVLP